MSEDNWSWRLGCGGLCRDRDSVSACFFLFLCFFLLKVKASVDPGQEKLDSIPIPSTMFHQWVSFLSNRTHALSAGITHEKVSIVLGLFGIKIHYAGLSQRPVPQGITLFLSLSSPALPSCPFYLEKTNSPPLALFSLGRGPVKPLEIKGLVSVQERK